MATKTAAPQTDRRDGFPLDDAEGNGLAGTLHVGTESPAEDDLPAFLKSIGTLYGVIVFLVVALTSACFLVAWLVTSHAY